MTTVSKLIIPRKLAYKWGCELFAKHAGEPPVAVLL